MADVIANFARGRLVEKVRDSEDLILILLDLAQADDALRDYDNLDALLANAGNDEADFTGYTRRVIENASIVITVDDTANTTEMDFPDELFSPAGNGTNNNLVKALVCVDGANDAARLVGTLHDFVTTTDGNDLTVVVDPDGFYASV